MVFSRLQPSLGSLKSTAGLTVQPKARFLEQLARHWGKKGAVSFRSDVEGGVENESLEGLFLGGGAEALQSPARKKPREDTGKGKAPQQQQQQQQWQQYHQQQQPQRLGERSGASPQDGEFGGPAAEDSLPLLQPSQSQSMRQSQSVDMGQSQSQSQSQGPEGALRTPTARKSSGLPQVRVASAAKGKLPAGQPKPKVMKGF